MFHTIIIAGNIGRDPEMRYTPSGVPVTSFSVASSRQYSNTQGQTVKETIWFRVTCWSKLAEYANNYLKKGNKVLIEGRLVPDPNTGGPRVWTRNDGTASASFEVNASTIRSLTTRSESENAGNASGGVPEYSDSEIDEDEIPF
ncbi:MAG TPA: single-stranded DNA-binding protein [Flexilinea sp.]|nr:MAG: Single-stranded DNA-binding protein [Chloroflexi bacterium ADurb.Bin344]HOG21830.1 single-stranded DNA-binding protein [Flexilinea sp.]HOP01189.1 single-stranded DNA-binding protein [Flexilinea sp.]HOR55674.1 single-stranded DNA-binding protein [Flexilinea sp.]HOU19364.1 single-stranded DNA-binding protein [Flexilinea sp.]